MISGILSLSTLTFKEGVRDRAIIGIGLFAVVMISVTLVIIGFFMRELSKVAVDINLSAISLSALLLTFFLSINIMAKDIDKKTIYCVMSKPLSRSQYIWGKYIGLLMIILAAFAVLTLCTSLTLYIAKAQYGDWFKAFSWIEYFKAIYASFLMFAVLNAIIVFFSAITSSSFITLIFSSCIYIAGQSIEEVVIYLKSSAGKEAQISESVSRIIDIAKYALPNLSVFDLKVQAAHAITISMDYLVNITLYGSLYVAILMIGAALIFNRRELS